MRMTQSKLRKMIRKVIRESIFLSTASHSGGIGSAGDNRYHDLARAYHQQGGSTIGGRELGTVSSDKEEVIRSIEHCQQWSQDYVDQYESTPPPDNDEWVDEYLAEFPSGNITRRHLYFISNWCRMDVMGYGSDLLDKIQNDTRYAKGSLNESDRFHGILPQELWEISDYEDYRDSRINLKQYSDEELQMKIEQLLEEIEEEKNYMDDPQNQYDMSIAPKESLINVIQDILDQGVHQRPLTENFSVYSERGKYIESSDGSLLQLAGMDEPKIIVSNGRERGSLVLHRGGRIYLQTNRMDKFFSNLKELCDYLNQNSFEYEGIDDY